MALTGKRNGRTGGRGGQLNAAPTSVMLALTLLLLAACSDDSSPTVAPTSSSTAVTTAASTTPTTGDPAVEIVARYTQFWEVRFEANRDPVNPADPRLAQLATGLQLDNVLSETRQRRDQGLAVRRPDPSVSTNRVKIVEVVGDTATLQDCATNDGIIYRVATGQVLDEGVVTRSVEATMLRVDGAWRLADTHVLQEWKGVAGCAQSPDFS